MANTLLEYETIDVPQIDAIMEGQRNVMIGIEHDEVVYVPFTKAIKKMTESFEQRAHKLYGAPVAAA